ncbi:RodZ family helix-turn-helix domain-containing protein [Bacillus cereus]
MRTICFWGRFTRILENRVGDEIMTIWDNAHLKPSERPKYTSYELAKMVKEKRLSLGLTVEEVAIQYNINTIMLERIEAVSCAFNVKMYYFISAFLGLTTEEIIAKERDDMTVLYASLQNANPEIKKTVHDANAIFDEMVMQLKISV